MNVDLYFIAICVLAFSHSTILMELNKKNQTIETTTSTVSLPRANASTVVAEATPTPADLSEISKKILLRHKRTGRSIHAKKSQHSMHYPFEADKQADIQIIMIDTPTITHDETIPFLPYPGMFELLSGMFSNSGKSMEPSHCTCKEDAAKEHAAKEHAAKDHAILSPPNPDRVNKKYDTDDKIGNIMEIPTIENTKP